VNLSGIEFAYVQHQSSTNPWASATGTPTPNWSLIRNTWKANAVRIPLNESSWFGTACTLSGNASYDPDPGDNYKAVVIDSVNQATAAGLYVIVDLHWNAPAPYCAYQQNAMGTSKSVTWWTDVANTFKNQPNVLFELFNEPFPEETSFGGSGDSVAAWTGLLGGLTLTRFSQSGYSDTALGWTTVGMQNLLSAVRSTGATNVVLAGGLDWSQNLSQWLASRPSDPLNQMAAVWHAYGYKAYEGNPNQKGPVSGIVNAGYPVVITEYGDNNNSSSFVSDLLPWADNLGISYLAWSFNPWAQYGSTSNVLIADAAGNPTPGYGNYVKTHYVCREAGTTSCP
jgi:endoglucanase